MTIKQLGGVFGRNPTFNDVTIDGTLTFDGDIDISSDLKISGDLEVTGTSELDGNVAIGAGVTPTYPLTVEKDSDSWIAKIENIGSDADAQALLVRSGATAAHNAVIIGGYADGAYKMLLRSSGNLELLAGNLVIGTSGKGIDFSATAGAGSTSELLDDYEEGAFTPAYQGVSGGSWTYGSQSGTYTKIGNMVNVRGQITTSAGSGLTGNIEINLPYTAAANTTGTLMVSNLAKTVDSQLTMFTVGANTRLYEFRNNGPYVAKTYANLGAAHTLFFSISYTV
jgi:hypothetical protein